MWWLPYGALVINLLVLWFMPKRLTNKEIYVTWFVIAMINLSSDWVLTRYLNFYELNGGGFQLRIHILEWTLGASYGIIYLNFMPKKIHRTTLYIAAWLAYALIFETALVYVKFVNYSGWKIWYSAPYYLLALLFLRWHLHYIRTD